jgi:hypothetical protein
MLVNCLEIGVLVGAVDQFSFLQIVSLAYLLSTPNIAPISVCLTVGLSS